MSDRSARLVLAVALAALVLGGCGKKRECHRVEVHEEVQEGPVVEDAPGEMIVE